MSEQPYMVGDVQCYGELEDTSNFDVVCEDEFDDGVWLDGNPMTGEPFETWEEVVAGLSTQFESIVEIRAM